MSPFIPPRQEAAALFREHSTALPSKRMLAAHTIADLSPFALAGAVCLMLVAESLSPLVPLLPGKTRAHHALRNVTIALCTSLFAIGGNFFLVGVAAWTQAHQWGLLNMLEAPWLLRFAVALAGLDFFEWIRHRLHHHIPLLWRLHRVHQIGRAHV